MPHFEAKTAQQLRGGALNQYDAGPEKQREPLCKVSDGTSVNVYYHRSKTDTVDDVSTPGHFNFMRETFRSGAQKGVVHCVTCHLGTVEEGLTEIKLHLVDAPTPSGGPVVMAAAEPINYKLPDSKAVEAA